MKNINLSIIYQSLIVAAIFAVLLGVYFLIKLGLRNSYSLYLDVITDEREMLIVDKDGRISEFTRGFKELFPNVKKAMKFNMFIKISNNLSDYKQGDEFVCYVNGSRYFAKSEVKKGIEIFEIMNISKSLEEGALSIRRLFHDFDNDPVVLVLNLDGTIISASVSLNKYWWLFEKSPIIHLSDLGLPKNIVKQFIDEVKNRTYLNGSLSINADGIDVLNINANMLDKETLIVDLNLIGEASIFSSGQYDVMSALLDAMDDGLIATDNFGEIVYANKKMHSIINAENLVGLDLLSIFKLYTNTDREIKLNFPLKSEVVEYAWLESPFNTDKLVVELVISEVFEGDGFRVGYVLNFRDTSVRQKQQRSVYDFAYKDSLTGTYNRHYLKEVVEILDDKEVSKLGLLLVDCDGLKVVNDAFGHDVGDEVIVKTADVLKQHTKNTDRVIRVGGDEFVVSLVNYSLREVKDIVKQIRLSASQISVHDIPLSVSIGFEYHDKGSFNFSEILGAAEVKMYHDKMLTSKTTRERIMNRILVAVAERNPWEKEHSDFVHYACELIARDMDVGEELVSLISNAGRYHSIGKIGLTKEVHLRGGDDKNNKAAYDKHTSIAFRILSAMPEYSYLANGVLLYKENFDGTGFPQGLKGEEIPLSSRILRVSISLHKMINPPVASVKPLSIDDAMVCIRGNAGKLYDPRVVQSLENILPILKLSKTQS